jgi:hypothetical protein
MLNWPPFPLGREAINQQEPWVLDLHTEEINAQGLPLQALVIMQEKTWVRSTNATKAKVDQLLSNLLRLTALCEPSDEWGVVT